MESERFIWLPNKRRIFGIMCDLERDELLFGRDDLMDEFITDSFNLGICMYLEWKLEDYCNKIFDPLGLEIFKYTIENSIEGEIVPEQELTLERISTSLNLEQEKAETYLEWMREVRILRSEFIAEVDLTIYRSDRFGKEIYSRFFG